MLTYHVSWSWVIKSLQKLNGGAFSTATAPHQSQSLAFINLYIESLQNLNFWSSWIYKMDAPKFNVAIKFILEKKIF